MCRWNRSGQAVSCCTPEKSFLSPGVWYQDAGASSQTWRKLHAVPPLGQALNLLKNRALVIGGGTQECHSSAGLLFIYLFIYNAEARDNAFQWSDCTLSSIFRTRCRAASMLPAQPLKGLSRWSWVSMVQKLNPGLLGLHLCSRGSWLQLLPFLAQQTFQLFARSQAFETAIPSQVPSRHACFPLLWRTPGSFTPRDSKLSLFTFWGLCWYLKLIYSSIPSCSWWAQRFAAVPVMYLNWPLGLVFLFVATLRLSLLLASNSNTHSYS